MNLSTDLQAALMVAVALVAFMTVLGHALLLFPRCAKAAAFVLAFGVDIQKAIAVLNPTAEARARALGDCASESKPAARGFSTVGALAGVAALSLGLLVSGCSWLQTHPNVPTTAEAALACVETELAKDAAAGDTPTTIGIDLGVTCGPLAIQVLEAAVQATTPTASPASRTHVLVAARLTCP